MFTTIDVPDGGNNQVSQGINNAALIVGTYQIRHGYLATPMNAAPSLAIAGPDTVTAGDPDAFTFTTTDDSTGSFSYVVNWGDGNTDTASAGTTLALNHIYAAPGNYTISATVTDPGGLTSPVATHAVTAQPAPAPGDTLVVNGTDGPDVIVVSSTGPDSVSVYINGASVNAGGVHQVIVHGLGGNDVIVASAATLPVSLFGDGGDDVLFGGQNNDLLSGGPGSDTLFGLAGRDILLGGAGSDALFGGGGDDLLIGGTTAFDTDANALAAIQREWTSSRSYADRVANLRGDAGSPTFDQRQNGNTFLRAAGASPTVFDDAATDYLFGDSGRDWYFASLGGAADFIWQLEADELTDHPA